MDYELVFQMMCSDERALQRRSGADERGGFSHVATVTDITLLKKQSGKRKEKS